ncbi:MAG TPA: hypothetical protein VFQ38_01090 [Longimicrobiales bacterium]|nr:hypothetical protein [Longimicrobiales bacterium]
MEWRDEDSGDVAFADDVLRYELPPAGRVLRRGGAYEVEEPRRIPALPALLRSLDEAGVDFLDPDVAGLVPARDVAAFCLRHGLQLDQALRLLRGQEPYRALVAGGWLQSLWLNLILFEEGDPVLAEIGVPLPVAELHSPWIDGCESGYEVTTEEARGAGLKLQVRGVGAGGGLHAKLRFHDRLWTEAACGQVTIPGDIEVVPWTNPDTRERIDVVSITNISAGEWSLAEIPAERAHPCSDTLEDRLRDFSERERRGWLRAGADFFRHTVEVAGGIERERTLEREREFSLALGEVLELTSQFTREYTYSYKVAGKADYVGYFEDARSEAFFWAWRGL